jgi:hypothetical protein
MMMMIMIIQSEADVIQIFISLICAHYVLQFAERNEHLTTSYGGIKRQKGVKFRLSAPVGVWSGHPYRFQSGRVRLG